MIEKVKYILVCLIALVICFALLHFPNNEVRAEDNPTEYWAVIVGVADYQYLEPAPLFLLNPLKDYDLEYSDDDAIGVCNKLNSIWGSGHTKLLVDSWATKSAIQDAIIDWLDSREDENDVIIFFLLDTETNIITMSTYHHMTCS